MSNKQAVRKLLGLLREHKRIIGVIIGCLLISTGLNLCIPLISRQIMDDGFIGGNKSLLIKLVLITLVIYGVNSLIDIIKEKKRGRHFLQKIQYFLFRAVFFTSNEIENELF